MTESERVRWILLADDDSDARLLVSGVISVPGYDLIEAADGGLALECLAERGLPDLALLDYTMPVKNGMEVCSAIRKMEAGELVPVLMLTARDSVQDKIDAFETGVDDYLTKPFNYLELQARVKALIRVRELNLKLQAKHQELQAAQARLLEQERQLAVAQLGGAAAHQLGQPLTAMLLNLHLLESMKQEDSRYAQIFQTVRADARRMMELLERLKCADASKTEAYHAGRTIIDLNKA